MITGLKPKLLIVVLLLAACSQYDFTDTEGNGVNWTDFQGRWIVLNYWAVWCGPCIEEIPELNKLHQKYRDQHVSILGINYDRPELGELKRQMAVLGVEFTVLHTDLAGKLDYLLPSALPTTYIFDREGKFKHKLVGPQTAASIEQLLKE